MSTIWIPKWIFGLIRTGVKDLSTGVKYMDSKVDFWFICTGVKDLITSVKYMNSKVDFWFIRTSVKDLSTSVKYMDSKVDFWFYSYQCQGSEYWCQVYGFQSGFSVLLMKVMLPGIEVASILGAELDSLR